MGEERSAVVEVGGEGSDGDSLEEGVTVTILVPEPDETFELTPDEEAALEESLKQAAQGQFVDAEALLRELRQ